MALGGSGISILGMEEQLLTCRVLCNDTRIVPCDYKGWEFT